MAPTRFFFVRRKLQYPTGGMTMSGTTTRAAAMGAALSVLLVTGPGVDLSAVAAAKAEARQAPQGLAEKLSGTWVMNRELSTGFAATPRGRGGQPRLSRSTALFAAATPAQRGGGGGDASDLTPAQRAEQAAMRELQQVDTRITIKAAADSVTFIDAHGERTYAVTDKASEVLLGGSPVKVKMKWDKQTLKQEFSNSQAKLVQTWSVDGADRLVMTAKIESLALVTPERKAVFDRQ
jgi:hypothetical protein